MTREELEHLIRAAAEVTDEYEFVVVGSQSILGPIPNPPPELTMSMEADIFPMNAEDKADKIDRALGEGSHFHETFGYYAQGVDSTTACLPQGWKDRWIGCSGFRQGDEWARRLLPRRDRSLHGEKRRPTEKRSERRAHSRHRRQQASIEEVGWELFRLMLEVASGRKKTWAEHWKLHNALVLFNPAPVT
jgi:D-galactarate dehydratase / Altronate hydrolase, C terminus